MGSYEPYYSSKLRGFLKRAGINIVVNPYANSLIQGRLDPYPKRRGFAQLKELLAEGVNVSLGNDVIVDPWYLLGKADLVDAASSTTTGSRRASRPTWSSSMHRRRSR